MKKLLALVAVMAMALTVTTGCTPADKDTDGGQTDEQETVEITLSQNKPEIDGQLKAYAADYEAATGVKVNIKSCGGGTCELGQQLKADFAAGEMPDIFVISGPTDYEQWKDIILDQSNEKWTNDTSVAFKADGKTYGFPVSIEGWGLAYNADLLEKAGVDPSTLNNLDGYKAAFEKIDGMKAELGIDSVVSMAAGPEMTWVTSDHNWNSYLSNGLAYGDKSVVKDVLAGNVDAERLADYASWVGMLFQYADQAVLNTGNYDSQVGAFVNQKAVFLHQGNWVDGNLKDGGATFKVAFAPHGSSKEVTDGIFVSAPSYYVINGESKNVEAAKAFLNDLVYTEAGNNYMVNEAGMLPAFGNIKLQPAGGLSQSVQAWAAEGKVYSWNQYDTTEDFRRNSIAPIYSQFASGQIDEAKFIELFTKAIESLK